MDRGALALLCFIGGALAAMPELRPEINSVEKYQNESFVIFCKPPKDVNEEVTWKNPQGKTITTPTGRVHVENRGGLLGVGLFIDRMDTPDKGRYTCTSAAKESVSFELFVFKPSQFQSTPPEHRVNEFQNAIIRCDAVGDPKPALSWWRQGTSLTDRDDLKYVPIDKGLRVLNASKSDAGVFTCMATQYGNSDSLVRTLDIAFIVQHKPEWREPTTGSTTVYGYLGGETNLTCDALAQPPANYTWFRNNKEVKTHRLNATEILQRNQSVLRIFVHDSSVYGQYQCQAKNFLGSVRQSFDLLQGEKPSPPSAFKVTSTGEHHAVLKIAADEKDVRGYRALYVISRPGQEVTWERPDYQDMVRAEDAGHYKMTDLLEDTPYTVRLALRGPAGLSEYSTSTVQLRTLKAGQVGSLSARVVSLPAVLLISLATLAAVH